MPPAPPPPSDLRQLLKGVQGAGAVVHVADRSRADGRKVAVIGAGPAGITAAYELSKNGAAVDVYEAGPEPGGLAKTIDLWDQRVDLGPHRFFSTDARVNRLWLEVVGQDYEMIDRLTRIFYKNRFFYYPLRPANALLSLGPVESLRCVASYVRQKASPAPAGETFEGWVVRSFGRRLFEIFFKTYSEKLWGIPCSELDSDFAAQRIKKLSLYEAIKNAFWKDRGNRHKTLVDRFAYPNNGTGVVYERMAARIRDGGNQVFYRSPVKRVVTADGSVIGLELTDGSFRRYERVVSTMPLTLLVERLPDVPRHIRDHAGQLRFRNTILVYLRVESEDLFPDNWLYVHSAELQTGRVTNFRNWSRGIRRGAAATILSLEYWCGDGDQLWTREDRDLIALAKREIQSTGLTGAAPITAGHVHRIPRCYPVYRQGYKEHLKPVERYLSTIGGLSVIGRYGAFKYNNQDHSILMGILAARNILTESAEDLWAINTDYENYQEAGVITEEGLVAVGG